MPITTPSAAQVADARPRWAKRLFRVFDFLNTAGLAELRPEPTATRTPVLTAPADGLPSRVQVSGDAEPEISRPAGNGAAWDKVTFTNDEGDPVLVVARHPH